MCMQQKGVFSMTDYTSLLKRLEFEGSPNIKSNVSKGVANFLCSHLLFWGLFPESQTTSPTSNHQ